MATGDKPSWAPGDVFKEDPAAERGFDETALQNTIAEFATKHGLSAAIEQIDIAMAVLASQADAAAAATLEHK